MKSLAAILFVLSTACVEYETTIRDHVKAAWADDETQIGFSVANCVSKDTPGGALSEVTVEAPCSQASSSGTRTIRGKLVDAAVTADDVQLSILQDEPLDPPKCAPAQTPM